MTSPHNSYNLRALCAKIAFDVIEKGTSLNSALINYQNKIEDKDRALVQEISFGLMRYLPELEFYVQKLMDKVFVDKNRPIHFLILVGLYQIAYTRVPEHAAASETVNAALKFKKPQLKGVINGVLRSFIRQKEVLKKEYDQMPNRSLHPTWLLNLIKQNYPDNWAAIIDANNQKPPMWLRVNAQKYSASDYQDKLKAQGIESDKSNKLPYALKLTQPIAVNKLPEFELGVVTVQDLHAQRAAYLLDPKDDELILDLCAAPGGKTTHILELAPKANVIAVDNDEVRAKRIKENLERLNINAKIKVGDGTKPEQWCKGMNFDKILLDAPCSATGVIRRHPDIKWLRRESDIKSLTQLQMQILTAIWAYLKPGGTLVYATCSILKAENSDQINAFLSQTKDATLIDEPIQYLPNAEQGDGFFYAKLQKVHA